VSLQLNINSDSNRFAPKRINISFPITDVVGEMRTIALDFL